MRFAKLGEEVYRRQSELVGEELRLYIIIFFHTWVDNRKCNKTLRELCKIYRLDYDNSCRRLKALRAKGWVEDTKKYIRPEVGFKTVKTAVEAADRGGDGETVNPTVEENKTVNFTAIEDTETVNSTVSTCKNYSEIDAETVNSTVSFIPYIEPFKDEIVPQPTTRSSSNKNLSQFSIEECLLWMDWRVKNGEEIEIPDRHRIAKWAHRTGESDAFIYAALYPEGLDAGGRVVPKRLSKEKLDYYVKNLRSLSGEEFDVEEWRKDFVPEDWNYLMEQING